MVVNVRLLTLIEVPLNSVDLQPNTRPVDIRMNIIFFHNC